MHTTTETLNTEDDGTPMRCPDCGRSTYYDLGDDNYHHATNPATGCFLIGPEDREPLTTEGSA